MNTRSMPTTTTTMIMMTTTTTNSCPLWSLHSVRLRISILVAVALCIEGLMRTNMNMAMVCMVNRTATIQLEQFAVTADQNTKQSVVLAPSNDNSSSSCAKISVFKRSYNGDLVWTSREQAWIFAAFYVGGLFIVLPGSYLCDWFGSTHTVQCGAVINVIGSMLTPYISREIGVFGVVIIRFLMGCGQGVLVPCMGVLIAHWFPLSEKSTAVAIATTGNQLSIILAMFITAELCQVSLFGGWPVAFYLYGLLGVGLCYAWFLVVKDVPTRYKHITDAELAHITGSAHGRGQKRVTPLNVPWRKILSSMTVWSTALSSFCQSFVIVGTVTYLPVYYRTVLSMDLTSNGVLSALPFIIQLLAKLAFAGLADRAKESGFSPNQVTKVCNLCASLGGACCFAALIFVDCNHQKKAVTFICLAMGVLSGYVPGYNTSIVCIAPKYTSSVASFCRLWGTIGSVVSPYIIGVIIVKSVLSEWRIVFTLMIGVLISTGLFFQLCGAATVQEWALDTSTAPIINNSSLLDEKQTNDKILKLNSQKGV